MIVQLSDADLLARMRNFEDHFVERKVVRDERDWKKTAVAFANSAPTGLPAVLYIGVRDNGQIETPQPNLDDLQKKFNAKMQSVYPRVPYILKIVSDGNQSALAVIVPGSDLRPHFTGLSYVRRGSQTFEASEEQFMEMLARRSSKAARILEWKDKNVTVMNRQRSPYGFADSYWGEPTEVRDCNEFWVTLQSGAAAPASVSLSQVELNFDDAKKRLKLEIMY